MAPRGLKAPFFTAERDLPIGVRFAKAPSI